MNEILTLPKPKYEVGYREYRRQHLYTVDGKDYPSVTKVLNIIGGGKTNALIIWARREALKMAKSEILGFMDSGKQLSHVALDELMAKADKQPEKIKSEAADIGSRVHAAIDDYISGKTPTMDAESRPGFDNFMRWAAGEGIRLIAGDTSVVSLQYGYGGRLDALGYDKSDNLVLLDWKTSNAMRDEYPLQVAAYAQAFAETYGVAMPGRAIVVRFGKETPGDFEPGEVNLPGAWLAFKGALDLHNAMGTALWAGA